MGRKLKGQKGNTKGLKGALIRHVQKDKLKKELVKTAEVQKEQKTLKEKSMKNGGSKKKQQNQQQTKGLIPFNRDDTLLLVGEGDFTFARSIIEEAYILPENLIATSFDSLQQLQEKYPGVDDILASLKDYGVRVYHDIDAMNLVTSMKLNTSKSKNKPLFKNKANLDYIMFNFPHTGRGMKDVDRNIRDHQRLILNYFQSCKELFSLVNNEVKNDFGGYEQTAKTGKIVISMFEGEPYISWGIKILGRSENYRLERSGKFDWNNFPLYHHKRTNGIRDTTKPAAERDARVYVFEEQEKRPDKEKEDNSDNEDD